MRTTITIDDDVLLAAQARARRERRTTGQVLSDLARSALTTESGLEADVVVRSYGFRALAHRGVPVSDELIERLREDEPV